MRIHFIAFNIPFPADYGGVIDVFYKLKRLNEAGFEIILHCFQYDKRNPSKELEQLAVKTFYYQRNLSIKDFFSKLPFIVKSRENSDLLENLLIDDAPILFEGIHTTFFANHTKLNDRKKIVRLHNIEFQYYENLAKLESNILKKIFYYFESLKLKNYEKVFAKSKNVQFLAINEKDKLAFEEFGANDVKVCSPFHPFHIVNSKIGKGNYVLFHGHLAVKDNEIAATRLIEDVFAKNNIHFIVAGKNPSLSLINLAKKYANIEVISNPSEKEMSDLLQNAQINLLWSFQADGVKLKLLYALFEGRFVLANKAITNGLELNQEVFELENMEQINDFIQNIFEKEFDEIHLEKRKNLLENWIKAQNEVLLKSL